MTIGKVIRNNKNETTVLVHPYKGLWRQMRVIHLPLYRKEDGELTVEPTAKRAEAVVNYSALVLAVELLRSGELIHSSARTLIDRNWCFEFDGGDGLAALFEAESILAMEDLR